MKNLIIAGFLAMLCMPRMSTAQINPLVPGNFGIWETFTTFNNKAISPELRGRLCNVKWKEIETSYGVYDWTKLDSVLNKTSMDSLPLIFMVYTKEDAPDWLFTDGNVPKVIERSQNGDTIGYAPYYMDTNYRQYFKEMVVRVKEHVDSLPWSIRQWIIGVQPCFGATGDYISYKGIVDPQYDLTSQDFYFLFKEFTLDYFEQYENTNPKITMLSNPLNQGENQSNWLEEHCPGGWIKTGSLGKAYQLNDELDKSYWLLDFLNTPRNGDYIRARSEIGGDGLTSGWWNACKYKNVFAVLANCIFWGVDWSNQNYDMIDDPYFDPAYFFFNRYAGQKNPATSTNAMCALRDGLDAADTDRFPESSFGKSSRKKTQRYSSILDSFINYGAKLDDINSATKNEMGNRMANGINDVGWRIFPGNYDRYLHQLTPNETSAGYWNVQSVDSATTIYGRFARGFDLAKNKDALYFILDTNFLRNAPLNAQYPVSLDIVYLDKGNGSWKLFYDATDTTDKKAFEVQCTNSGYWKTASVTLYDAYFGKRASHAADFYIKSNGDENVIFELVEFARPDSLQSNVGIRTSQPMTFDTVCINSNSVRTFSVSGDFMNNKNVVIGPAIGYSFSFTDSAFTDSVIISDYGNRFQKQVFVKLNTTDTGSFTTAIPVYANSQDSMPVIVSAYVANSYAALNASVVNVSCYNAKNGSIQLNIENGIGPYSFAWTADSLKFTSTKQNLDSLLPGNYRVDVLALGGCKSSANYVITQPEILQMTVTADSMICKNGFANVAVAASGGTLPYIGTGIFPTNAGNRNFVVTDSNGCVINKMIQITNGTKVVPPKPVQIFSEMADSTGLCNGGDFDYRIDTVEGASNYKWTLPENCSIVSASADSSSIVLHAPADFSLGSLSVVSENVCGTSTGSLIKNINALPVAPAALVGPVEVLPSQKGIYYKTSEIVGLTYNWTYPAQVKIVAGQGTATTKVNWGVVSGNVTVYAQNGCGQSNATLMRVNTIGKVFSLSDTVLQNFDTTCVNGLSEAKSITASASGIYGAAVIVGPVPGFKFSPFLTGTFQDSIIYQDYGNNFNKAIYIKFSPVQANTNEAFIPIRSEGFQNAYLHVSGEGINSSPVISASVTPVNCFNDRNGTIDVQTAGGTGPFIYSWKSSSPPFSSDQSFISGLKAADYTVTINSYGGCTASSTFTVTQPDVLTIDITADDMYCKNTTTNVYVNGAGGNLPYTGTGTFTKGAGSSLYSITDAKGCTAQQYFNVVNGTMVAPIRPTAINGLNVDEKGICYPDEVALSIDPVANATNYSWSLPYGFSFVNANADSSQITILPPQGFSSGAITVISGNACGTSLTTSKTLNAMPSKPISITGNSYIQQSQQGLNYFTENVSGIIYTWTVPVKATIVSGQNSHEINVDWGNKAGNVTVKKSNGCATSNAATLYVSFNTGFQNTFGNNTNPQPDGKNSEPKVKAFSAKLYPNPAKDFTRFYFIAPASKPYTIQLADMNGKVLQQMNGMSTIGKNEMTINLGQLANGMYQLIYINEKGERNIYKFSRVK